MQGPALNGSMRTPRFEGAMRVLLRRGRAALMLLGALFTAALIAGCGGSGGGAGTSPQSVSGVAATGAPLVGNVTLKDSSSARTEKQVAIANDGTYSIDVTGMQAPFLLRATGTADGASRTLYSFADKPGIANINPLSNVALASAAGVDDPATVFADADATMLDRVDSDMPGSINTLKSKLKLLLDNFGAAATDPLKGPYSADHTGLDGMFDNVDITVVKGVFVVTNATTGAVIFTARVSDVASGRFSDNDDDLPKPSPRPAAPTNVTAVGGDGQITVSWDPVDGATSYSLFYSTQSKAAANEDSEDAEATQLKNVASPFVVTELAANTTYYFTVRAIANHRRGPASAEVSASTGTTTSAPSIPATPSGVTAIGGAQQTTVSWNTVSGAASYNLYWSTTTGVTTSNGTKISGVTSPSVQTGLADNTTYYYVVTAENSAGESTASVQVAATTLDTSTSTSIPAAPTDLNATGGDGQVTLSWSAVAGASSYNIYWSTSSGVTTTTGTRIAGASSPYVHTGLSAGTQYYYIITAENVAGESSASTEVSATTNAAIDGAALYTQYCSACHGALGASDKQGASAALITSGIANVSVMHTRFDANTGTVIKLTPEQIAAISAALQ